MKKSTEDINDIVPILRTGAMAAPDWADGRLIPILNIDCSNHKSLLNLIHIHQHTPPGDVVSRWAYKRFNGRNIYLVLEFQAPMELKVLFLFDLRKDHAIADAIVQSRAVYLQPSEAGATILDSLDKPRILLEIPSYTKLDDWDKRLLKQITKKLKKENYNVGNVKKVATEQLYTQRNLWQLRR